MLLTSAPIAASIRLRSPVQFAAQQAFRSSVKRAFAARNPASVLEAGVIRATHALQRIDHKLVLVELKTKKSKRTVKLGVIAAKALRERRASQVREQLRLGSQWIDHGLVFTGAHGMPLECTALTKRFQKLLASIGLPRMRFHDLRHSSATLLLAQHIPARVVMERLGHSTINLTLDTYSHVIQSLNQ